MQLRYREIPLQTVVAFHMTDGGLDHVQDNVQESPGLAREDVRGGGLEPIIGPGGQPAMSCRHGLDGYH